MKAVFRVDASIEIGSGHVARCMTLAQALARRGAEVRFVCRAHAGHLGAEVAASGIAVELLPLAGAGGARHPVSTSDGSDDARRSPRPGAEEGDARYSRWLGDGWQADASSTAASFGSSGPPDLLVADHYAIDHRWERALRCPGMTILAIDDLADREHDCDVLLDQNYYRNLGSRYDALVPAGCKKLLGPRHALLREEFLAPGRAVRVRGERVDRILVFFGGMDRTNETAKALDALRVIGRREMLVDVVVGRANPHRARIEARCKDDPGLRYHCQTSEMADLMAQADLALGACGTATWERAFLGLPSVVVSVATNQERAARDVHDFGAHLYLGPAGEVDGAMFAAAVRRLAEGDGLARMSDAARRLMGGDGFVGADGVAAQLVARIANG